MWTNVLSKPATDEINKTQIVHEMKLYTITFQQPLSVSMYENSQIIQDIGKSDVRISCIKNNF